MRVGRAIPLIVTVATSLMATPVVAAKHSAPPVGSVINASLAQDQATSLSGAWVGSLSDPGGNPHPLTLQLTVEGSQVTGTITGGPPTGEEQAIVNGKLTGDALSFDVKVQGPGGDMLMSYRAKLVGNKLVGTQPSPMGDMAWEATRK